MKMTLRKFLEQAGRHKDAILDSEVFVIAPNGLKMKPKVKVARKDIGNLDLTTENIDYVTISIDD
jgi:hypothetical protein